MNKTLIIIGMSLGTIIGSYAPTFFGVSAFSWVSILTGAIGGGLGIYISYKLTSGWG